MRYRLRTLLILLAVLPPLIAAAWIWMDTIPAFLLGMLAALSGIFGITAALWLSDVLHHTKTGTRS
jgi:hypothetical protein